MPGGSVCYLDRVDCPAREPGQGRHAAVGDPARHDQGEIVEVGGHVEGKPVAGNPARDAHADRGQLLAPDPDPGQPVDALCENAVVGRCSNQDVFEVADVPVHIATVRLEIDDGIADDLSGP